MKTSKIVITFAKYIRRIRNPRKYKSLGFLCDYMGEDVRLNDKANAMKEMIVSQICTIDSDYSPKNNICLFHRNPVHGEYGIDKLTKLKEKGSAVFITNKQYDNVPCILSKNPFDTYARLCRYYRDLSKVSVTAVSGSIGKSTVKQMVASVYSTKFKIAYTKTNSNTKTGVGFAVQHIPNWAEKMIQEIHEGEPNETQFISEMLNPDVYIITAIDQSHLDFFGTPDNIIKEVCSVTKYMSPKGIVIVNSDEFNHFDLLGGRTIVKVSNSDLNADFCSENINVDDKGLSFYIKVKKDGKRYFVRLNNVYAVHNVSCALLAFAAGFCEDVEPKKIIKGLSEFKTEGIRQNIIKTADDVIVYADCYNAVGRSMKSAIDTCDLIPTKGARIAVLGDVEEVGAMSDTMHKEIIKYVNLSKFDVLMLVGEKMKKAMEASSVRETLDVSWNASITELSKNIKEKVRGGDLVLFKASHSGNLDKCIIKVWPELRKECSINKKAYEKWVLKSLFY